MAERAARRPVVFTATHGLRGLPPASRLVFRGNPAAQAAAGAAFGVELPQQSCRAAVGGARTALWLGPDEFLLLAPAEDGPAIEAAFDAALAAVPHSRVDVSHRQVGLQVSGPQAEWLLESHCPLPLNLRDFPVDQCTRTVFAKAEIVLWREAPERFRIEVWRSFAPYVAGLLREVEREIGAAPT
jgi:sarcosine oxidase subunit gamma